MKQVLMVVSAVLLWFGCAVSQAQQVVATNTNVAVPPLINFSGTLTDASGKPLTSSVAATFSLYSEQTGGAALWMETQNVTPDSSGHYTVMLGSTSSTGLPANIFVAGEAHWLGVQIEGEAEQPRVLIVSAPYALKAGDAQTLGGLPASAFVLTAPASGATGAGTNPASDASPTPAASGSSATTSDVTTSGGTENAVPLFTTSTNIQNSILLQSGRAAISVAGKLNLPATGIATSSAGKNSQPLTAAASAFDSSTGAAVTQTFQWQAQPANNDTSNPSSTLNLLFGSGTSNPAQTGLSIASNGQFTFAQGQTFPGAGTITGVTAGTGLSGGGTSGNLTITNTGVLGVSAGSGLTLGGTVQNPIINSNGVLTVNGGSGVSVTTGQNPTISNTGILTVTPGTGISVSAGQSPTIGINTTVVPQLTAANVFTGTQTINNLTTIGGAISGGVLQVTNTGTSSGYPGIVGTTSSTSASGVKGVASASTGVTNGVYGSSASNTGNGVEGSSNYVGAYGVAVGGSGEGVTYGGAAGIWGDTNATDYYSVLGTADENTAGAYYNNSSTYTTLYLENDAESSSSAELVHAYSPEFGGECYIYVNGDLSCNGTVSGVVSADSGSRKVTLYSVQSAENWFEDAGSGQLANGSAQLALDPTFASTVNTGVEYHVFLTPKGDCAGLYVTNETPQGFEVHELRGGHSSIAFDYRIMAKRNGYENVRLADVTAKYQQMEQQQKLRHERMQQRRAARVNGATEANSASLPLPLTSGAGFTASASPRR